MKMAHPNTKNGKKKGSKYTGGDMVFSAGESTATSAGTGGAISLSTGIGKPSSSGRIILQSV